MSRFAAAAADAAFRFAVERSIRRQSTETVCGTLYKLQINQDVKTARNEWGALEGAMRPLREPGLNTRRERNNNRHCFILSAHTSFEAP